jgi:membrane-associated phospholipid phosphatase
LTTRRWLIVVAVCAAAVVVCMAYVDRPVADYVHTHLSQTALFAWTSRALGLLAVALIPAVVVLVAAGVRVLGGRPIPVWGQLPLVMSMSAAWALAAALVMKHLIGRSSPYPWYVERHVYAFHPVSNAAEFAAFPSATTAVTAAWLAVVWIRAPRLRVAGAGLLALIAVALVLTNSHWLSDVIGGGVVGASVGWLTVVSKQPQR